jgi:hypothetical protein
VLSFQSIKPEPWRALKLRVTDNRADCQIDRISPPSASEAWRVNGYHEADVHAIRYVGKGAHVDVTLP